MTPYRGPTSLEESELVPLVENALMQLICSAPMARLSTRAPENHVLSATARRSLAVAC